MRVLLCPGDRIFWRGAGGIAYRGRPEDWPAFVDRLLQAQGVKHIVCLGEGRQWHAEAIRLAHRHGIAAHVVEQGYLRPGWLTIERATASGEMVFPRDPWQIAALAERRRPVSQRAFRASFASYALMDVAWNLANVFARRFGYRHYRTHALDPPLREWAGWIGKALAAPVRRRRDRAAMARAMAHYGRVFVFPLQLETDFQIRLHGPPGGLTAALTTVVESFARMAPPDALLVVKRHPLDNGWAPWHRQLAQLAEATGVADRCLYLTSGDLDLLLERSAGVVTVNSTVGLTALRAAVPVAVLGRALYDIAGLVYRGPLDRFWAAPPLPDRVLVEQLVTALQATIQVPGGFDGSGAEIGAEGVAERILAPVLVP
ncbi:MAG: capsular biosynthesis protein [Pseudomonadota bacterium]